MSDEEHAAASSSHQLFSAEYKDCQLQIVEVTPYEKDETIVPEILPDSGSQKYMQVLEPGKGLMQLDLLNLTLVRCDDGEESYRLVTNGEGNDDIPPDATVTCVLTSSDGEEGDNQEAYVMVEGEQGPLVLYQTEQADPAQEAPAPPQDSQEKALTPAELIEKAKVIQKAKKLMANTVPTVPGGRRGRKRKSDIPSPHELLASPNFKLYLYSCKLCSFKCNAIKELTAHKSTEHTTPGSKFRVTAGGGRPAAISLQCARCPFRGATHTHLMKHIEDLHGNDDGFKITLDSDVVESADVLVCGACGFESASKSLFRHHIDTEHDAIIS